MLTAHFIKIQVMLKKAKKHFVRKAFFQRVLLPAGCSSVQYYFTVHHTLSQIIPLQVTIVMSVQVSPRNRVSSQGNSQDHDQEKAKMNGGGQSRSQRRTLFQKFLNNHRSLNRSSDVSSPYGNNHTANSSFSTDGGQIDVTSRRTSKSVSPSDDTEQVQVQIAAKSRDNHENIQNRSSNDNNCNDAIAGKISPEAIRERHNIAATTSALVSPSRRLMAHERDGFCIAVDSYDGHTIYVDETAAYEISTYLGGGVAGVVYEGRRLVPFHNSKTHRSSSTRGEILMRDNSVLRDDSYLTGKGGFEHAENNELADRASNICRTPMAYFCEPNFHESTVDDLATDTDLKLARNGGGDIKQMNAIHRFADTVSRRRYRNHTHLQQSDNNALPPGESDEDVAIKILNPIGFRLQSPSTCATAIILKEGLPLDDNVRNGLHPMTEKNVWWLVSPTSRNLKAYLESGRQSGLSSNANHNELKGESSSATPALERGSPQKGVRMSMIAAYLDHKTGLLHEIPLPKCIEIWGHAPFGSSEKEFEEMMDAIDKVNDGIASPEITSIDSSQGFQHSSGLVRATVAKNCTVFCTSLDAYITVPAIPPKYLRWLRQRRAVTKEIRNMLRLGRHKNVVHLYEVLELIQDSKSIMFLVLELVRGGELFDLISVHAKEGAKASAESDAEDETAMFKFFQELVGGIAYCHTHGVAHRDLKPENLVRYYISASLDVGMKIMPISL